MPIATIHVDPTSNLSELTPIRRLMVLLWLLVIKDRATSVRHAYSPGSSELSYQVDGQWRELVPIPDLLASSIGPEIRSWINPSGFRRALADLFRWLAGRLDHESMTTVHGRFLLVVDPIWSLWGVSIQQENDRATITFELLECHDWCHDQALPILKSFTATRWIAEAELSDAKQD